VSRLRTGEAENVPFVDPANFKVSVVTETRWRPGWYFTIGIDGGTVVRALTGAKSPSSKPTN
jgi:hypothetical protein